MTTVVVNPDDLAEDIDQVIRGMERQRFARFEKAIQEVYESNENLSFG
ncbi:hypothetical protein [Xanthomonas phage JGB6]|nr:hypothetical protein [Xanthomonas phage JGB6]